MNEIKGIRRLNPDEQTHLVFTHSATEAEVLHTGSIAAIVLLVESRGVPLRSSVVLSGGARGGY